MKVKLLAITPNAEELIESAGRTCYQSQNNGNVGTLIKKLIASGHHSVLEHAYATFRIGEVSRALTHQLVRHRLCAFSQQSQRYVKEAQFDYVTPDSVILLQENNQSPDKVNYIDEFKADMELIQTMYNKWKSFGLKNEDARFVLPNACHTEIVISANFREFRHIFEERCSTHAQWEIRSCAKAMLTLLHIEAPNVFDDLKQKYL